MECKLKLKNGLENTDLMPNIVNFRKYSMLLYIKKAKILILHSTTWLNSCDNITRSQPLLQGCLFSDYAYNLK